MADANAAGPWADWARQLGNAHGANNSLDYLGHQFNSFGGRMGQMLRHFQSITHVR